MNSKTLEVNSIPIPPQLTGLLKQALGRAGTGFDEGAFLQQLHYWTLNSETRGWLSNGVKWIYNSLKAWQKQFPWMSEYGLRKAIANLKKLGLIQTAQHWLSQYKRVMFYRINYERLQAFAGNLGDLITPRAVNSDRLDVQSNHISNPEISSKTSFSEQATVVVAEAESVEAVATVKAGELSQLPKSSDRCSVPCSELSNSDKDNSSAPSSGKFLNNQDLEFPELIEAVAQAIGQDSASPIPKSLKAAIAQFPDRVPAAIAYLQHQRQHHSIRNPIGYLHQAILQGWKLAIVASSTSLLPAGFNAWFSWAKAQGWVLAATTIDGIHHTLHVQQGWIPTKQLMHGLISP
ncbi:hypothetical protein H6F90_03730 [Trichocoleus sp. FACHB-591]|uniref:hypothetical protein n=1 Tax=Trichocoleus sp. FACHB-591 TaxID=2692872 RepID=UPI001689F196|nr:hypothetical protein [Trichocoleus sp. FACHB-591]MBD2094257.1 hypothetical protein [Trichocoleus sp. FACHB-591]